MIAVDYDEAFEASIFGIKARKTGAWAPAEYAPSDADLQAAHAWLVGLRRKVKTFKIPRIMGTRMFLKTKAAMIAGVKLEEIKKDLLMSWSPDELRRAGEQA
jgi:hypothetical protein